MAVLNAINPSIPNSAVADPARARLSEAADRIVGSIFYGTLLKALRSSSLGGEYGHGGRGEDIFQAQLDQVFAEEAGRSRSYSLSEAVARSYARQQETMDGRRRSNGGES